MSIVLRWLEEPYTCEVVARKAGRVLRIAAADGRIVWEEPVSSASAAWDRAREIRERLIAAG